MSIYGIKTITDLFQRFNCTKEEQNKLLDYLQAIRINQVINEIKKIRENAV